MSLISKVTTLSNAVVSLLVGSLGATLGGAVLGWHVSTLVRGRNTSDVGVPMWEHGELAFAAGLATHLGLVFAGWYSTRHLKPAVPSAVSTVSWCVRGFVTLPFLLLLRFSY